ncbi:hypothetical protein [Marinobacter changyiensis]|uniref:hypothetical protein n=1 Tax=Marinobacter changyiensis TaxID=2604091 RepID=UPI001265160B|nr:hypothetical protein [Marinobacter changyiensis]
MPRKIPLQHTGGMVDESLKARTDLLFVDLPKSGELLEVVKVLFGRYRCLTQSRDTEPSRAEEIRHAEKTLQLIDELQEHLSKTPESIKAQIGLYEWRLNREFNLQPFGGLNQELNDLRLFAGRALNDVKQWKSKTGERPKQEEHDLLSQVSSLLEHEGLTKLGSADLASKILRSEGVRVPEDPAKAREVILAVRKREHPRD